MMKMIMKIQMALVRKLERFGLIRRSYFVDTSVGSLLENIEYVYNEKLISGYPVISEKRFQSQQQIILSGFYELSPFRVIYVDDKGVSDFLKMRECDLFSIAKNPFSFSMESKNFKYMISFIDTKDELVLRGLARTIYLFTHCYTDEYENWIDCLIVQYFDSIESISQSNRLYRIRINQPMLGGSVDRCRVLEVLKVYVEEDSVVYALVKQFLYNDILEEDGEEFLLHYLPDLGDITYALENLIMVELFDKAFDKRFPGLQYFRFLNEAVVNCTSIEDERAFNVISGYHFLEDVYLPGEIQSIGPGDSSLSLYNGITHIQIDNENNVETGKYLINYTKKPG